MNTHGDDESEDAPLRGPVETAVAETLDELERASAVHDALLQMCLSLARAIDLRAQSKSGQDGMATAALARELRSTLELLLKGDGDDSSSAVDKLLEHFGTPVSTPVRNT